MIDFVLNAGSAISGGIAAFFWFKSAMVVMPKEDKTWGGFADVPGKIIVAVDASAKLNRVAALFSGIAAAFVAVDAGLRLF